MDGVEFRRDLAIGDSLGDPQLVWGAGDVDNFSVALWNAQEKFLTFRHVANSIVCEDNLVLKDGKVGIGTTNPIFQLQVVGTVDASDVCVSGVSLVKEYSTTEVNTGNKWIDDKPIFRKVYNIPAMANDTQDFQPLGFTMDAWVGTGGYVKDGATTLMLPVPVPNSNTGVVGVAVVASGVTLQIHAGAAAAHDGGAIWLEYTKE